MTAEPGADQDVVQTERSLREHGMAIEREPSPDFEARVHRAVMDRVERAGATARPAPRWRSMRLVYWQLAGAAALIAIGALAWQLGSGLPAGPGAGPIGGAVASVEFEEDIMAMTLAMFEPDSDTQYESLITDSELDALESGWDETLVDVEGTL